MCTLSAPVAPAALSYPTPRSPPSTSNGPSSTASGTTPSHRIPIRQIARLFPDEPLAAEGLLQGNGGRPRETGRASAFAPGVGGFRSSFRNRPTVSRAPRAKSHSGTFWKSENYFGETRRGAGGAKDGNQGKRRPAKHAPDAGPGKRVTGAGTRTASRKAKQKGAVHVALAPCRSRHVENSVLRDEA